MAMRHRIGNYWIILLLGGRRLVHFARGLRPIG